MDPALDSASTGAGETAAAPLLCLPEFELPFAATPEPFGVSGAPPLPCCEPPPLPADVVFPPAASAAAAAPPAAGPRCGITLTATGAPFQIPR